MIIHVADTLCIVLYSNDIQVVKKAECSYFKRTRPPQRNWMCI